MSGEEPPSSSEPSQKGETTAAKAPTHGRAKHKFLFILLIIAAVLVGGIVIGEVAVRWRMPWLLPQRSDYSKENGLPFRGLAVKLLTIKQQKPDYVIVGDSHVETGSSPGGWIDYLCEITGKKFGEFSVSGTGPTQYFILLDRLRAEGITAPVVMVMNIGNDFFDDGLYASLGADKSGYLEARGKALNDPATPQFWPCMDGRATVGQWFTDHSALYRALFFAKYKLEAKLAQSKPVPSSQEKEEMLVRLMENRCDKPNHSEQVNGRLFFFNEHEAQLSDDDPLVRAGKASVTKLLHERCNDPNLWIAIVLAREETSAGFHGKNVTKAAPYIEEMKKSCRNIIDPNTPFYDATLHENLYLPDSHWNLAGGKLFAEQIKKALGL